MKTLLTLACFLIVSVSSGQIREEIFDISFRPTHVAGYYYVKTEQKNGLWHREAYYISQGSLYMEGAYKDDSCKIEHGDFRWFYSNGRLRSQVTYSDGNREGLFLSFHENGMLKDSVYYSKGKKTGVGLSFHSNGYLADSTNFDGNGNGVQVNFYDEGMLHFAGHWMQDTLKKGRWKYYHRNGNLMAIEEFDAEGNKTLLNCFNEKGVLLDTALCSPKAAYVDKNKYRRYLEKSLQSLVDKKAKEGISGSFTVMLRFLVNTDGSISEVTPLTNYGHGIEDEVVKVFKGSPKWVPGRQFGRLVRTYHTQPISFVIID